ncbi:hypothetical protein IAU59_007298 [Kwoniella sp. CBS 9459]
MPSGEPSSARRRRKSAPRRKRRQSTVRSESGEERGRGDDTDEKESDSESRSSAEDKRGKLDKSTHVRKAQFGEVEESEADDDDDDNEGKRKAGRKRERGSDDEIGTDEDGGSDYETTRTTSNDRPRQKSEERGPPDRGRSHGPRGDRQGKVPGTRTKREKNRLDQRERGSKERKAKPELDIKEKFEERSREINAAWNRRPSAWSGCCGDCSKCWVPFWGWSGWRTLVRNAPYVLALLMGAGGMFVGATGELLGVWTFHIGGATYGGLGYCKSGLSGCRTEVLYDGPKIGLWPLKTLSALLLSYAIDPESQRRNPKNSLATRRVRSLKYFERSMDLAGLAYLALTCCLAAWVSEGNVEGDWGWNAAIFLGASPLSWLLCRMTYRSRWAYHGSSTQSHTHSGSRSEINRDGWDEEKYGKPAIDDRERSISSYVVHGDDQRAKRIKGPQGRVPVEDDDD